MLFAPLEGMKRMTQGQKSLGMSNAYLFCDSAEICGGIP